MTSLNLASLKEGKPQKIEVDGKAVCVAKVGEEIFAIADTCSHSDASLSEGDITDFKIECWLHGAEFDLRTGTALSLPATTPVEVFAVKLDGDTVTISTAENN